jgi:hypothetical protein
VKDKLSILDLTQLGKPKDDEEIPEPGEPGNEWLGTEQMVNGQKQFKAWSGAQLNRIRRAMARGQAREQANGQRRYNREQRRSARLAGTRRAQLAILKGETDATPAMRQNLERAVEAEQKRNAAKLTAVDRGTLAAVNRERRLDDRRVARFTAGHPRGADLRDGVFQEYSRFLPDDYTGKRAGDR